MVKKTRVIKVHPDRPNGDVLAEAGAIIRNGGLVAFATETVYGLGADATNRRAVAKIYEAKGRPSRNPLIVHADDFAMARSCVRGWTLDTARLAGRFWPGPLTLVLPRSSRIPDIVSAGGPTVGVRVPGLNLARLLIRHAKVPIAAPSANRSNGVSPTLASHVLNDLKGRVDLILDGGPCRFGLESTVVDLTQEPPRLLRPGILLRSELERTLKRPITAGAELAAEDSQLSSPGQLPLHYSPCTSTLRVRLDSLDLWVDNASKGRRLAIMNLGNPPGAIGQRGHVRVHYATPDEAERDLYARLREWDESGLDQILIVTPPDVEGWAAVRDRVWRATGMQKSDSGG